MHVKLLSVKLNHFQSNGPFKHTTFHFQKYNSEHKIRSQLCSRPPNIRAVVVAGKHIWNRKLVRRGNLCQHWGENLPWSPPCQEKWKKIKKLWVNRYSQNRTLSWASARLKCKPHTHKLGRSGSECVFKKQSNDVRFDQIDFLLWNGGMWWEKVEQNCNHCYQLHTPTAKRGQIWNQKSSFLLMAVTVLWQPSGRLSVTNQCFRAPQQLNHRRLHCVAILHIFMDPTVLRFG